jgi:type IV pilus assembly protein PilA
MFRMNKNQKGFTLIELLIVIAIIAILAAIAIPQFSAYRMRAYNASAVSDLGNLTLQEASMSTDWQRFGVTAQAALPGPGSQGGAGALVTGGLALPGLLTVSDSASVARGLQIPVGNGVSIVANADLTVAPAGPTSFTAVAKHVQGDATFGTDADAGITYKNVLLHAAGIPIVAGDCPASVPGVDDIAAAGANWIKQ